MQDFKKFLKIGLPCLGEQGLLILTTTVSAILVSRLGENELLISNMTTTIVNWMQAIFTGLALGVTVVVSNAYGKKDMERIKKAFFCGMCLVCGVALLTFLVALLFCRPLVVLFYGSRLAHFALFYFLANMLSMPATAFMNTVSAATRGVGDSMTGFVSTVVLNVINIFLIYLFCYQKMYPLPFGGLVGAGIAILVSRYLAALFSYLWIKIKKTPILPQKSEFTIDKSIVRALCKVGVPTAVEYFIFRAALLIQQQIIIPLGNTVQGGYQIGMRVIDFASVFATAFQMTAVILIAQEYGKGAESQAVKIKKMLCRTCYLLFAIDAIFIYFASPFLASLFTTDTGTLLQSGIQFAKSIGLCSFFLGVFMTYAGILRGAGDNKFITVVTNLSTWGGRIALSIILLQFGFSGYVALSAGLGADFVSRALIYHIRLRQRQLEKV